MKTPRPQVDCGNCGATHSRCGCGGCSPVLLAFALFLAFVFCFTFDRCASGQEPTASPAVVAVKDPISVVIDTQPEIPPGTQPGPLVAPTAPTKADVLDPGKKPAKDEKPKPSIKVSIGGVEITTEVVTVTPGQLVEFEPVGAAKGVLVGWNYSSLVKYKTTRDDGHYVGATFENEDIDRVILVAPSWNGDASGYANRPQRWLVVAGKGPQPPPNVVVPPKPAPTPTPTPNPVTTGSKRIIVIRESLEPSPEMGRLIVLMQSGPIGEYMKSKKHEFESFDKDAKDENGNPSAYVKKWIDAIGNTEIPAVAIVDIATGTIDDVKPLGKEPTAKALLDLAKEHGG